MFNAETALVAVWGLGEVTAFVSAEAAVANRPAMAAAPIAANTTFRDKRASERLAVRLAVLKVRLGKLFGIIK